jgi:hypothetical protein
MISKKRIFKINQWDEAVPGYPEADIHLRRTYRGGSLFATISTTRNINNRFRLE